MIRRIGLIHGIAALVAFLILAVLIAARLDQAGQRQVSGPFYAIDGDTLASGPLRLRLVGLDAPERDQTCRRADGEVWACGEEARRLLARLAAVERGQCLGRVYDRYGRLLARCHAGGKSINARLVREGMAVASGDDYAREQAAARREGAGIWGGAFDHPRDWRAQGPSGRRSGAEGLWAAFFGWLKALAGWR